MPFQKGRSGNPNGRPPKKRALATILEQASAKTIDRDGKSVARKRILSEMLWDAAVTGQVGFRDSKEILCAPLKVEEWISLVKFLYTHIDGPATPDTAPEDDRSSADWWKAADG